MHEFVSARTTGNLRSFYLLSQLPETLQKEKRKPFSLTHSNPLANLALLMTNGAGLRKLSLSALLYLGCNNVNMSHGGVQLGILGWTVNRKTYFGSVVNLLQAGSQGFIVPRILSRGKRPCAHQICR